MLLNICWVPLGHFRTEDDDQRVADAFSMSAPSLADLRIFSGANEALEAWSNCGDVLDRLFLLSVEFRLAEDRLAIIVRSRYLGSSGSAVVPAYVQPSYHGDTSPFGLEQVPSVP
jgi:hypothetical protein